MIIPPHSTNLRTFKPNSTVPQAKVGCNEHISWPQGRQRQALPIQNLDPDVSMMQSAKDLNCRDGAEQ